MSLAVMVGLTEIVLLSYSQVEAFATELSQVLEETFLHTNIAMLMCSYDVLFIHLNSPQIAWDIAVYDEVHILKNEKSLKYISIMK